MLKGIMKEEIIIHLSNIPFREVIWAAKMSSFTPDYKNWVGTDIKKTNIIFYLWTPVKKF